MGRRTSREEINNAIEILFYCTIVLIDLVNVMLGLRLLYFSEEIAHIYINLL